MIKNPTTPVIMPHGPGAALAVVKIVSKEPGHAAMGGFVEINETDFDETKHTKYVEPPAPKVKTGAKEALAQATGLLGASTIGAVVKIKGKNVPQGDIVEAAFLKAKLATEAWNALSDDERAALITGEIELRKAF